MVWGGKRKGDILYSPHIGSNGDSHFSEVLEVAQGTCLDGRQSVVTQVPVRKEKEYYKQFLKKLLISLSGLLAEQGLEFSLSLSLHTSDKKRNNWTTMSTN